MKKARGEERLMMSETQETQVQSENKDGGIEYYWCVNCGYSGKFTYRKYRSICCQNCRYEHLTPYELEEINSDEELKLKFLDVLK